MADERKVRKYVRGACERCRRQKLKCDVNRPCMLCSRAGVECVGGKNGGGRRGRDPRTRSGDSRSSRPAVNDAITHQSSSRPARNAVAGPESTAGEQLHGCEGDVQVSHVPRTGRNLKTLPHQHGTTWGSSATFALVETANLYNKDLTPVEVTPRQCPEDTQLLSNPTQMNTDRRNISDGLASIAVNGPVQRGKPLKRPSGLRVLDKLLNALPQTEATNLLVDTYFDRVHWFMLVFHQQEFRERLRQLQNTIAESRHVNESSTGFVAVLLTAICISLQYIGPYRRNLLQATIADEENLQQRILKVLEESFLAIISLGDLQSVQVCVLLGSFYLYHGDPATAWPVCGCALRIAQALSLHREVVVEEDNIPSSSIHSHEAEARKRCWWALYELETFCCTLYGYTCTISDKECDISFLDTSSPQSADARSQFVSQSAFTLLTYKNMMSKLSVIVRATLTELYGHDQLLTDRNVSLSVIEEKLENVIFKVDGLNRKLSQWHSELPAQFKVYESDNYGYQTLQQSEEDIGGSGPIFHQHMIQLQAIALKFAYENARILANRPLLCYKLNKVSPRRRSSQLTIDQDNSVPEHIRTALETCQSAALKTAAIGEMPGFKFAICSYAAAFMSTHIFTAGVALCLSAIIDPLTDRAAEAKNGLRKLIELQTNPVAEPLSSSHVTIILERLVRLMLEKELNLIMGSGSRSVQSRRDDKNTALILGRTEAAIGTNTTHASRFLASTAVDNQAHELNSASQQPHIEEMDRSDPFSLHLTDNTVTVEALREFENILSSLATDGFHDEAQLQEFSLLSDNVPSLTDQEQAWIWSLDPSMRF